MIPKVNFVPSWIYQKEIHTPKGQEFNFKEYYKSVNKFIPKLKKRWRKVEKEIFREIEKLSGLKWKKEEINCYVLRITSHSAISFPLTIPIQYFDKKGRIRDTGVKTFIDFLVHELIHNIFIQNTDSFSDEYRKFIENKYDVSFETSAEIPVHAIHKGIYLKFFNKNRLEKDIKMCMNYPNYKKSWKIINREGSKNIIKEMRKFIQ